MRCIRCISKIPALTCVNVSDKGFVFCNATMKRWELRLPETEACSEYVQPLMVIQLCCTTLIFVPRSLWSIVKRNSMIYKSKSRLWIEASLHRRQSSRRKPANWSAQITNATDVCWKFFLFALFLTKHVVSGVLFLGTLRMSRNSIEENSVMTSQRVCIRVGVARHLSPNAQTFKSSSFGGLHRVCILFYQVDVFES